MPDSKRLLRVLIVDDDSADRELLAAEIERAGFRCQVDFADTLEETRRLIDSVSYDFALADYRLRAWRGTDVIAEFKRRGQNVPVILVTGSLGEEFADECLRAGASDFVLKHRLSRLPAAMRRALDERRLRSEHAEVTERNRRLSVAVDQSPAGVLITDPTGKIEYVNRRFSEITGYSERELLGQNPRVIQSGRTPPQVYEDLWRSVTNGRPWRDEILNRRKSGELYWSQVSISPLRDAAGTVTHFVAVHEDVSERKWAEEVIREREERFRQVADNIKEVFWVVAADFREMLYLSPAYEEVWGRSRRSAYEQPASFMDAVHADDRPGLTDSIARTRAGEDPGPLDFRVVHTDGAVRWVSAHAAPVLDETGRVYRISGVALDITTRKLAEDALRESEERFRKLVDASFDVIVQSVDGVVQDVSSGFETAIGYRAEEAIGRRLIDFVADESRGGIAERLALGTEGRFEVSVVRKDGTKAVFEGTGRNVAMRGRMGRITALRDITVQRSLEEQLRQAQKMEAVARLAGGVAHDFNNLLTVIMTEIQLLRMDSVATSESDEALGEIEQAARRAAGLTRQLLTFSRRDVAEPRVLDAVQIVEGLRKMLGRLISEDVKLDVLMEDDVGSVLIDGGHLEQVIVNLVVNARDAMPRGGQIRIEVQNAVLDEAYTQTHSEVRAGEYVLIAVSDTGTGMSREVQARIFEPFFTTKEAGQGTGLGLATSYGIVREAGGHFSVYSEVGLGTTMKVYLPRVPRAAQASADAVKAAPAGTIRAAVLVVEDEDAVRRSAVRGLESLGCTVFAAGSGEEGLEVLRRHPGAVDVIFTDVVMPGLGGPEFVAKAKQLFPDLRVVYTTGYTADMAVRLKLVRDQALVLTKPYTAQQLAEKIRAAMSAKHPAA